MKFIVGLILALSTTAFAEQIQLTTANTVTFRGAVGGTSVTQAQIDLQALVTARGDKKYKIYLVLDTPGGSVVAGDAFIQFAKTIRDLDTISIFAASMGSAIVEGIPGTRYITQNGVLMFHRARGQFQGQFETGEVESQLNFFKSVVRAFETINATRMGLSLEAYKEKVKDEFWVYGNDAVVAKAADKQIDIVCSDTLVNAREIVLVENMFGAAALEFSKCPLLRAPIPKLDTPGTEEEEEEESL